MIRIASPGYAGNIFLFAKQTSFLRKPAVISNFFTGKNPVVLTVNLPVKTRYFWSLFNGTG
jgi:hypothetical protein